MIYDIEGMPPETLRAVAEALDGSSSDLFRAVNLLVVNSGSVKGRLQWRSLIHLVAGLSQQASSALHSADTFRSLAATPAP